MFAYHTGSTELIHNQAVATVQDALELGPLFQHSLNAIIVVDLHDQNDRWSILACNPVASQIHGYTSQELLGMPLDQLTNVKDGLLRAYSSAQEFLIHLKQAGSIRFEALLCHKSGTRIALDCNVTLIEHGGQELLTIIGHDLSRHQAAEAALRESQDRFQALFEHSPDGIFLMNPHAPNYGVTIIDCNDAACRMNGYSREELIGQDIHLLSPLPYDPIGRKAYLERLRGLGSIRSSALHRRKDGTIFPVEFSSAIVPFDGYDLVLGIDRDVTERQRNATKLQEAYAELESRVAQRTAELSAMNTRLQITVADLTRAQNALRRSEERYRSLIQVSTDIIMVTTPNGLLEPATSWCVFTGQTLDEAFGWGWLNAVHPNDQERTREAWLSALQTRTVYLDEYRIRRHDGTFRTFAVESVPVLEIDGSVREWVGSYSDITGAREEQQRQRLLNQASAVLGASLDYAATLTGVANLAVPDFADWCTVDILGPDDQLQRLAIAHTDPNKVVQAWKLDQRYPAAIAAGYGPSAVVKSERAELASVITDEMVRLTAQDNPHLALLRRLRVASYISVPLHARGRILGAVTFLITESGRRYSQVDLAFAEELARRASIAVDNAGLYQEARDALQARDDFLSVATHELKTPLTGLLGYTQILRSRTQSEPSIPQRDQLAIGVIHTQAERLHRLITSMLDLSRLQAGQFDIQPTNMDLIALTRRIVEEIQPMLEQHTVDFQAPDEPLMLLGDEARLDEVVLNLIQNAIKYSPGGGPVTVTIAHEESTARITVSDRGIGIPSAVQSRVFERFYRAWNVNPIQISGMGIGLYVVKEIVARHGGTIVVESTEGQGSTFTVRLPLLPESDR